MNSSKNDVAKTIIDYPAKHLRVLGPPGSGKTGLVIDRYRALTAAGSKVFVLTYSRDQLKRITGALLEPGAAHEELRQVPEVRVSEPPVAAKVVGDAAALPDLLDRWQANRERLEEARVFTRPVPQGLQFITWRGLSSFGAWPLQYYYRYVAGVQEDLLSGERSENSAEPAESIEISPDVRVGLVSCPRSSLSF